MPASHRLVLIVAIAGLAASIGMLWLTDIPLGVPGEWTWPRIPFSSASTWGWIVASAAAAAYISFVAVGAARIAACGRISRCAWMAALAVAGFFWLTALQSAVPGIAGLSKTHFVLYYPRSSGYFFQARYEVQDTREFLATYEDLLARRDYLHIGTHPPGLTLLFRGLLRVFNSSPSLVDLVLCTEPDSVRTAAATIRENEPASGRSVTRADEAVLWFAAMLAQAAAAATVIPLFILLCQSVDRRTAWFAAALWPLVPGIAIFLPKSDAVFPLISILGPSLWLIGWSKRSLSCCALAGLTLFSGMLLSLAIAPIAVLTAVATVFKEWSRGVPPFPPKAVVMAESAPVGGEGRGEGSQLDAASTPPASIHWWLLAITAAATGFFLPLLLLWGCCDLNLPRVWSWNVANHALFYDHNTRTWWKWLLENPLEAALAAGGPLAMLALIGAFRSRNARLFPLVAATAVVWGLLWLSGKNMGEAARLWLLFQPWLIVAAAAAMSDRPTGMNPAARNRVAWLA
ncbi:MAG: hypothetical protein JNG89_04760, partial [Planctomycetaceae bacterium]|nr:hypothetical protein [Planctomycetaceae bacterium]